MSLQTTRLNSFERPYPVHIVIADYLRVSHLDGSIEIVQTVFYHHIKKRISEYGRIGIPPETTIILTADTQKKLKMVPQQVNGSIFSFSPKYPKSFFEMVKLTTPNILFNRSCLAIRHPRCRLAADLESWQKKKACLSLFTNFPSLTPRLLDHLREDSDFSFEEIQSIGSLLGAGGNGEVRQVALKSGKEYALKIFFPPDESQRAFNSLYKCLDYMQMLKEVPSHPNVAKFEKLVFSAPRKSFGLCFELIRGTTFVEWLEKGQTTNNILKVVVDFMKGLQNLERYNYNRDDHGWGKNLMVEEGTERGVVIDYEKLRSSRHNDLSSCARTREELYNLFKNKISHSAQALFEGLSTHKGEEVLEVLEWDELISRIEKYLAATPLPKGEPSSDKVDSCMCSLILSYSRNF